MGLTFMFLCGTDSFNKNGNNDDNSSSTTTSVTTDAEDDGGTSVSGTISYNGSYSGPNTTIYIRAYTTNSNAIGEPDYSVAVQEPGSYKIALDGYAGDLYISAFMDVDNSGNQSGPNARDTLEDGLYSDPLGCYGEYVFETGGPTLITIDGNENGIDFSVEDSGVIQAALPSAGACTFGVISNFEISENYLHHRHCSAENAGDVFLLALPEKAGWYCKVKYDDSSKPQLYPDPITVSANSITEIMF